MKDGMRKFVLATFVAFGLILIPVLGPAPAAAEQELVRIPVPSQHIDSSTLTLNERHPGESPGQLMANVLLPDGYTPGKSYPLLLLLHGGSGSADSWVNLNGGNIRETARDLNAVIVMPDAAQSFYADWWNEGTREPGWEIWIREEVLPEIERRFSILPQRRYHAVAGLSMGGYGTWITAATLPGYFGTAVPLSSFASTRGSLAIAAFRIAAGVPYETVYGPPDGFYAEGHDPVALAANYVHTRIDDYTGDGQPDPETRPADIGDNFSLGLESELKLQNDKAVAAIKAAGSKTIDYTVHKGSHSWEYWRRDLQAAIAKGLFRPVSERPKEWTYKSSAARGIAWDLSFERDPAPSDLAVFDRDGRTLTVTGSGPITLNVENGCSLHTELPLTWKIPAACLNLRVKVKGKLRQGKASRLVVTVKGKDGEGKLGPVASAKVKIAGRSFLTNARGKAGFRIRPKHAGKLRLLVKKPGYRNATRKIRVRRR